MSSPTISSPQFYLFGGPKPFTSPPWETKDDRIRGGASHSTLSSLPDNAARFSGHLDTKTLGGAGFASQFSAVDAAPIHESINIDNEYGQNHDCGGEEIGSDDDDDAGSIEERKTGDEKRFWDLSSYEGIELRVGAGDGKVYTFIVRDEVGRGKRGDGRERAGISWEVEFTAPDNKEDEKRVEDREGTAVWLPWSQFKATYRGREKGDAGKLEVGRIRRVGIMMRSYFGKQDGDFSLEIHAISARKASSNL